MSDEKSWGWALGMQLALVKGGEPKGKASGEISDLLKIRFPQHAEFVGDVRLANYFHE